MLCLSIAIPIGLNKIRVTSTSVMSQTISSTTEIEREIIEARMVYLSK